MRKPYQVFYIIKRNHHNELNHIFVMANNAKEACKKCKEIVYEKTKRNAFSPTIHVDDISWKCDIK